MKTATKYQANQQTQQSIFIDVLSKNNEVLNKVEIDTCMNIKTLFTKKWGLSHAEDRKIIDFAKDLNFKFFDPSKIVEVKKRTANGIYFEINGNLHFYHKAMNSIVLCRETAPGKYTYNYGCNLNAPQQREIINFIKK